MPATQSILDIVLAQVANKLDVLLQTMFLYKLLQQLVLVAIASDDEMSIWMNLHDLWDDVDEKVYTLSLGQPRHTYYIDCVQRISHAWIRRKLVRIHSIWYSKTYFGVYFCS